MKYRLSNKFVRVFAGSKQKWVLPAGSFEAGGKAAAFR